MHDRNEPADDEGTAWDGGIDDPGLPGWLNFVAARERFLQALRAETPETPTNDEAGGRSS